MPSTSLSIVGARTGVVDKGDGRRVPAASSRPLGAELQAMVRGDQHLAVWAEVGELASGAEAGEHRGRTLMKISHLSIASYRAKRFLTSQQRA